MSSFVFFKNFVNDTFKGSSKAEGPHSTEVVFALLTQQTRVRISALLLSSCTTEIEPMSRAHFYKFQGSRDMAGRRTRDLLIPELERVPSPVRLERLSLKKSSQEITTILPRHKSCHVRVLLERLNQAWKNVEYNIGWSKARRISRAQQTRANFLLSTQNKSEPETAQARSSSIYLLST